MAQYISAAEFLASPYGKDYQPGESFFDDVWQVDDYLQYISSVIDLYCGRAFDVQVYDEYVTTKVAFLKVFPVVEIISIVDAESGNAISSGSIRLDEHTGRVKFKSSYEYGREYKITYKAGYLNIPDAIKQATMMLAHTYAQSIDSGSVGIADGGALTGFKFGKFQETYVDPRQRVVSYDEGIPVTVEAILRRFRYMK